jgi:hypothetical protein
MLFVPDTACYHLSYPANHLSGISTRHCAAATLADMEECSFEEFVKSLVGRKQVDPVKPTLRAPGSERLKLKYEELLSNFGFKLSLRRYSLVCHSYSSERQYSRYRGVHPAGAYTRPLFRSI